MRRQCDACAFLDAIPGLLLASQGAGDGGVDPHTALRQVLAQPHALAPAQIAELVIVVGAKRSLAMAYEVERSHDGIVRTPAPRRSRASDRGGARVDAAPARARVQAGSGPPGIGRLSKALNSCSDTLVCTCCTPGRRCSLLSSSEE